MLFVVQMCQDRSFYWLPLCLTERTNRFTPDFYVSTHSLVCCYRKMLKNLVYSSCDDSFAKCRALKRWQKQSFIAVLVTSNWPLLNSQLLFPVFETKYHESSPCFYWHITQQAFLFKLNIVLIFWAVTNPSTFFISLYRRQCLRVVLFS